MIKNPQSTKEEEIEILPEKCCNDKIIMKNDSKDDPKSWGQNAATDKYTRDKDSAYSRNV